MEALSQETIEKVSELIRKGTPIIKACEQEGTYNVAFKRSMPNYRYKALIEESRAYKKVKKSEAIQTLVERVCERVRNGDSITKAIAKEGEYNHVVYSKINSEQKRMLNLARAEWLMKADTV